MCFAANGMNGKIAPPDFIPRPAGKNPATVGTLKITQQPNASGLYGVRWSYAGHPDREKFSSIMGALRTLNAYRLELTEKGALIEDLVDEDSPAEEITLEDFSKAVEAWIEAFE